MTRGRHQAGRGSGRIGPTRLPVRIGRPGLMRLRRSWSRAALGLGALLGLAASMPVAAETCREVAFDGLDHVVCEVADPARLRLYLGDGSGQILGTFARVREAADAADEALIFAMNAGMYHDDRAPVGLYVEDGRRRAPIVTREGPGNFGLLPNGVFCVTEDGRARVVESRRFAREDPDCRIATQSGPMLVLNGDLHPRFLEDSDSRNVRNGVGVTADGRVLAAISSQPVTFHEFARLFRDHLGTPDALFLDGSVSKLYAPEVGRHDRGFPMGPILGLTEPAG